MTSNTRKARPACGAAVPAPRPVRIFLSGGVGEVGKHAGKQPKPRCEPRLADGMLNFRLSDSKPQGSFALIKHADGYTQPGYDAKAYDFSAGSLRSLAEIAAETPTEG